MQGLRNCVGQLRGNPSNCVPEECAGATQLRGNHVIAYLRIANLSPATQ